MEKEEKKKVGRPKKVIDYDLCEKLAQIQCTQEEIASIVDITTETLRQDPGFVAIYKKGLESGKMSLRRAQFRSALGGNATMLVWLGKQYLLQRDKLEADVNTTIDDKRLPLEIFSAVNRVGIEKAKDMLNKAKGKEKEKEETSEE